MTAAGAGPPRGDEALARELLGGARTIAVVARSARTTRPWHDIAGYLIEAGYGVYLVNPLLQEAHGRRCYDRVSDLPERVDIVDVFRLPAEVPEVVEDAIEAGAGAVWLQIGIVHEEAAARARAAGLPVVMNRCTKVDDRRMRADASGGALHCESSQPGGGEGAA